MKMISSFKVNSVQKQEVIDITGEVSQIVKESKISTGFCLVFVSHATAAVIVNENYDPNINLDFLEAFKNLVPAGKWRHDEIDGNADAHIKAAIIGPSETLIVDKGQLILGKWQNIMLVDFDGPRERKVMVKIVEG